MRAAEPDQIIDERSVALHLNTPIKLTFAHGGYEFRQARIIRFLLGKTRVAWKFDELIQVTGKTLNERFRPWQTDQRDASFRKRRP